MVLQSKALVLFKELFPNTSFSSAGPNSDFLTANNAKQVVSMSFDAATQKLNPITPFIDGDYVKEYEVVSLTTDEKTSKDNTEWKGIRAVRNDKLKFSDWTQLSDSPLSNEKKTEWQTYRQNLRQLPQTQTDPYNITWPTEPN